AGEVRITHGHVVERYGDAFLAHHALDADHPDPHAVHRFCLRAGSDVVVRADGDAGLGQQLGHRRTGRDDVAQVPVHTNLGVNCVADGHRHPVAERRNGGREDVILRIRLQAEVAETVGDGEAVRHDRRRTPVDEKRYRLGAAEGDAHPRTQTRTRLDFVFNEYVTTEAAEQRPSVV